METTDTNSVQAVYTYGDDLISMKRADVNSFYLYEVLGSVRQLTADNEAVVASYTYDSFGSVIASSGAVVNTYGFTGEQQFAEADSLVFLRARYYKPSIGRFINRDPIHYAGGINLYRYAKNNPQNLKDPSGLICCSECKANLDEQQKQLLNDLKGCLGDCGTVISPGAVACLIACAITGPYYPACAAACLGVDAIAYLFCTDACIDAYRAYMNSSRNAYANCMAHCE